MIASAKQSNDSFQNPSHDWRIDAGMIAPMRFVLAATALLIIYIDPSQPDRSVRLTYGLLIAYTAYSGVLVALSISKPRLLPMRIAHWLDLVWYVGLISTSSGTNSIFFLFFYFAILVASFRWGFASGLRVTIVSALLFATVGYFAAPAGPAFELNRFLLRSISLLVLGYMIAFWGGSEIDLKRRLRLLKDVSSLSNPRFGIEQTVRSILERLRAFYGARSVVLVLQREQERGQLIRVDSDRQDIAPMCVPPELESLLVGSNMNFSFIRPKGSNTTLLYNANSAKIDRSVNVDSNAIGAYFGAESFASIPVLYHGQPNGRLYILDTPRRFGVADVEFVLQVIEQVLPQLDNVRLLDRLASDAAERERKKLARDIHDSVIQPYVGLQFGLAAVRQKLIVENSAALSDINELCEVAEEEVRHLRRYLDELKAAEAQLGILLPAIRRFVTKYSAATGITVEILGPEKLHLNDRLAAEVFQFITEGLSNIRRHTSAQNASVELCADAHHLLLSIHNENSNGTAAKPFTPVSITERASGLGGRTEVSTSDEGTTVSVRIPL